MERESILFYKSFYEAIKEIESTEERLAALESIIEYGLYGEEPEIKGIAKALFTMAKPQIDANNKRYSNGSKGGRPIKEIEKPMVFESEEIEKPMVFENIEAEKPKEKEKEKDKEKDNVKDKENVNDNVSLCESTHARTAEKHKYGAYGWVLLTAEQYSKLCDDLGREEVERCIAYVDESAQSTGNKNKWRDWNLVVRRCSREKWGLNSARPKTGNVFDEWRNA